MFLAALMIMEITSYPKKKSRDKIDGIIALVMAIGRWQVSQIDPVETTGAGIEFL